MKIDERVKMLRLQRHWSQQFVAGSIGIDQSSYSKYEQGKLDFSTGMVIKIAKLYDESADYLLGLKD